MDKLKREYPQHFGEVEFALPEFQRINEAAYWDYQKNKVYIRSNQRLQRLSRKTAMGRTLATVPVNKVIIVEEQRPASCLCCNSTLIYKFGKMSQIVYDLMFSTAGVKRWVIRYSFSRYICWRCKATLQLYVHKQKYGIGLRQESDVDICVCCVDTFFTDYTFADYGQPETGNVDSSYTSAQFKNEVQAALAAKFGQQGVTRGDKALDVHANTYRVDADVVAAFAYRLYLKREYNFLSGTCLTSYLEPPGTKFIADSGKVVINWPEQHYSNGVEKNKRTGGRFKFIVRAVKRLKFYLIISKDVDAAKPIPSYLIECLLYNVPDSVFGVDSHKENVQNALLTCFSATQTDEACDKWVEVNERKFLFRSTQPWTRQQAYNFVLAAWYYVKKN